jgi:hypothetical protein
MAHFPVADLVLSVLGAGAGVVVFLVVPRRAATFLIGEVASRDEPERSLVGAGTWIGPRFWPMSATWPLIRLEQFAWGIRVGPNFRWIAWAVPTTELRWSDISVAHRIRHSIRFCLRSDPRRRVTFGPASDTGLIAALQRNGVPVE